MKLLNDMVFLEELIRYLETTPRKEIQKAWDNTEDDDDIGPTIQEYMDFLEEFKHNEPRNDTT